MKTAWADKKAETVEKRRRRMPLTIFFEEERQEHRSFLFIVNQTNTRTVSKATLGKLLRDRVERIIIGFPVRTDTISKWTGLNWQEGYNIPYASHSRRRVLALKFRTGVDLHNSRHRNRPAMQPTVPRMYLGFKAAQLDYRIQTILIMIKTVPVCDGVRNPKPALWRKKEKIWLFLFCFSFCCDSNFSVHHCS